MQAIRLALQMAARSQHGTETTTKLMLTALLLLKMHGGMPHATIQISTDCT